MSKNAVLKWWKQSTLAHIPMTVLSQMQIWISDFNICKLVGLSHVIRQTIRILVGYSDDLSNVQLGYTTALDYYNTRQVCYSDLHYTEILIFWKKILSHLFISGSMQNCFNNMKCLSLCLFYNGLWQKHLPLTFRWYRRDRRSDVTDVDVHVTPAWWWCWFQ